MKEKHLSNKNLSLQSGVSEVRVFFPIVHCSWPPSMFKVLICCCGAPGTRCGISEERERINLMNSCSSSSCHLNLLMRRKSLKSDFHSEPVSLRNCYRQERSGGPIRHWTLTTVMKNRVHRSNNQKTLNLNPHVISNPYDWTLNDIMWVWTDITQITLAWRFIVFYLLFNWFKHLIILTWNLMKWWDVLTLSVCFRHCWGVIVKLICWCLWIESYFWTSGLCCWGCWVMVQFFSLVFVWCWIWAEMLNTFRKQLHFSLQ